METAAVHGMATAITQLTLCQVSSEEIETATKLLEKACHKLGGILHQLSCILDSCTISASYEVSEAQKALFVTAPQATKQNKQKKYLASLSATRIVMLLASRMSFDRPLSHSSCAIVWKSLANFSWKRAREIVNLAWKHKAGSAPRISGEKFFFEFGRCRTNGSVLTCE